MIIWPRAMHPSKASKLLFVDGSMAFGVCTNCLSSFPPSTGEKWENSIAFGSAPRREADNQPISQLAKPAVSQTEAHSLGFLLVADLAPSSEEESCPQGEQGEQWPNGNAADRRRFGRRFEPRSGEHGDQDSNR